MDVFFLLTVNLFNIRQKTMYKKNLKFLVMSKDMAKSLVAAALTVAFSPPVAANTATGSRSASGAFSKQDDGIVMPTAADGSNNFGAIQGVKGLEDLKGKTVEEIKNAALEPDEGLSDADQNKVFFLYNVKTGKFLNAGGYWGTHVSLKDYPLSLWAVKNTKTNQIEFKQNMETGQGQYLGWMDGSKDYDDGVFIDRNLTDGTHYGWGFELQENGKYTYKIYTYATNNPSSSSTKYYLCANGDETDQDKNCGAFSDADIKKKNIGDYSTWRVLSMQQIYDLITTQSSDNMTSALDLSYRLDCPGFSRGDKDITVWKVSNFPKGTKGGWRFGLEHLYNTDNTLTGSGESSELHKYDVNNLSSSNYTFEGTKYTDKDNYERHLGKYFCADAKNLRGVIYQDVVIKAPGSYIIECKGYSTTTKAKIFASWFDKKGGTEDEALLHQNVLNQVSYMSNAEQDKLHVSEQNMDYAGKNFYGQRKYINTVLIQVPKDKKQSENNYGVIRFGLIIGDDQNDTKVDAAANEWTVFDDFRLLYASNERGTDLILDEDRDNLDYLMNCSSNTYKNTVLHLNKTFTKDKWNSFVLPVSLNRDQFRQAFGANARLAKLSNLTSSEIQFQTVDMAKDDNAEVLKAYTPYIIFPTKIHTDNTKASPAYKATLTKTNGEQQDVVIKANHYDIPNVTFKTNNENKNDLSQMDTQKWVSNVTTQVGGTDGSMVAYGTFARTFGTEATQNVTDEKAVDYGVYKFNDHEIISNRDDLKGSYFFDKGNLYYSSKRVRGLRGFSCWFKPVDSSTPTNTKLNLYIDGVANGTTGIDEVAFGDEEPTGKAAKGIYNMNGQLVSNGSDTTNLPAGMYIVNGKKCVVR